MTKHADGRTLYADLQMVTSSIFLCLTMGRTSKKLLLQDFYFKASITPINGLDVKIPQRKFAECLCCNVSPLPVFSVMSHLIKSTCHIHSRTNCTYIHSIHTIYTYIHAYIHTCTYNSVIRTWLHFPVSNSGFIPQNIHFDIKIPTLCWVSPSL